MDTLCVCDWGRRLSFYTLSGRQIGRDRKLEGDPTCVRYFSNGAYLCVGGSDRKVTLFTKEGVRLGTIAQRDGWVWGVAVQNDQDYVAVASEDGSISVMHLIFGIVAGLYRDT